MVSPKKHPSQYQTKSLELGGVWVTIRSDELMAWEDEETKQNADKESERGGSVARNKLLGLKCHIEQDSGGFLQNALQRFT